MKSITLQDMIDTYYTIINGFHNNVYSEKTGRKNEDYTD